MNYYLYILKSKNSGKYYIGMSSDPRRRLKYHNKGEKGSFTNRYRPWMLVYTEKFTAKGEALDREKEIKRKKSRRYIEYLIKGGVAQ